MAATPDFGWREGSAQLGSYRQGDGFGWIYTPRGDRHNATAGTLWAWVLADGPYTNVRMITDYEPTSVNDFPVRAMVRGGESCSFPSIEADALVSAGIATYA
jgi:hypothetical protein